MSAFHSDSGADSGEASGAIDADTSGLASGVGDGSRLASGEADGSGATVGSGIGV